MSSLPRFFTQIRSLLSNAAAKLAGDSAGIRDDAAGLLAGAQIAVDKKLGNLPPGLRKPALVSAAAGLAVLLVVLVGMAKGAGPESGRANDAAGEADGGAAVETAGDAERAPAAWDFRPPEGNTADGRDIVPTEELFLPPEPDFLPGVLPGRDRRAEWTTADALPWWKNPLTDGEERWRARIESMIDEIMEGVP